MENAENTNTISDETKEQLLEVESIVENSVSPVTYAPDNNIIAEKSNKIEQLKLDRNNTNFPIQLLEYLKKTTHNVREQKYGFLKYYQNITREYILKIDIGAKGILIAYTMGMGKSMIAVSIAMDAMEYGYDPIILTTKSLHENMRKSIIKY